MRSLFPSHRLLCVIAVSLLAPIVSRANTITAHSPVITAALGTSGTLEEYLTDTANITTDTITAFH